MIIGAYSRSGATKQAGEVFLDKRAPAMVRGMGSITVLSKDSLTFNVQPSDHGSHGQKRHERPLVEDGTH